MSTRDQILGRIRTSLNRAHNPTVRYSRADQRMRNATPVLVPERGRTEGLTRAVLFKDEARAADADVRPVARIKDVPTIVGDIIAQSGHAHVQAAPDKRLHALDWSDQQIDFGPAGGSDHVGLSMAYGGVAETGTLVMLSGPDAPSTLNFLPDVHIVVLRTEDIVANYEQIWAKLRASAAPDKPVMPRTVNWITGPSRTADIEQTLLLGAHGPRKLIILLIDGETD